MKASITASIKTYAVDFTTSVHARKNIMYSGILSSFQKNYQNKKEKTRRVKYQKSENIPLKLLWNYIYLYHTHTFK